jgi:hypothetical protein
MLQNTEFDNYFFHDNTAYGLRYPELATMLLSINNGHNLEKLNR